MYLSKLSINYEVQPKRHVKLKSMGGPHCNIQTQKNFQRAAVLKYSTNFTVQKPFYIKIRVKISLF
jgi:hypothetical protein